MSIACYNFCPKILTRVVFVRLHDILQVFIDQSCTVGNAKLCTYLDYWRTAFLGFWGDMYYLSGNVGSPDMVDG